MQTWMMTIPRKIERPLDEWCWQCERICSKKLLSYIFEQADVKRYIVAIEKGKGGLDHFQKRPSFRS